MVFYFIDMFINGRKYLQIGCKKNNSLVQSIDWLTTKIMHEIIKILISITYLSNMIKSWSLDYQYII